MILVIAEQKDGQVNRASWEAIVAGQKTGQPVTVVVAGQGSQAAQDILLAGHHVALARKAAATPPRSEPRCTSGA